MRGDVQDVYAAGLDLHHEEHVQALEEHGVDVHEVAPRIPRDHKTAGSSTCVRPQPRHLPRRGQNSAGRRTSPPPAAAPSPTGPAPRRSTARAAAPPATALRHFPPNLVPSSPWCHLRHLPGGLPRVHEKITGRAAAITDIATVTPSTTPRIPNPPNHIKTNRQGRTPSPGGHSQRRGQPGRHLPGDCAGVVGDGDGMSCFAAMRTGPPLSGGTAVVVFAASLPAPPGVSARAYRRTSACGVTCVFLVLPVRPAGSGEQCLSRSDSVHS